MQAKMSRAAIKVIHPGTCRAEPRCTDASSSRSIARRTLLISAIAGAAEYALPRLACASAPVVLPSGAANRRFSVLYKGDRIGAHTVSYSAATGQMRVTTEIDLLVKALFFTVFAFRHRSEEIWRAYAAPRRLAGSYIPIRLRRLECSGC